MMVPACTSATAGGHRLKTGLFLRLARQLVLTFAYAAFARVGNTGPLLVAAQRSHEVHDDLTPSRAKGGRCLGAQDRRAAYGRTTHNV